MKLAAGRPVSMRRVRMESWVRFWREHMGIEPIRDGISAPHWF